MRTTLDLDSAVLSAARAKAAADHISIGKAISELALAGLRSSPTGSANTHRGFPIIEAADGHLITDELVAEHRDD